MISNVNSNTTYELWSSVDIKDDPILAIIMKKVAMDVGNRRVYEDVLHILFNDRDKLDLNGRNLEAQCGHAQCSQ